jgi:hypothetical protein
VIESTDVEILPAKRTAGQGTKPRSASRTHDEAPRGPQMPWDARDGTGDAYHSTMSWRRIRWTLVVVAIAAEIAAFVAWRIIPRRRRGP